MIKKIHYYLLLTALFLVQGVIAQSKSVSGTVSDDAGTPLPGVNVVEKGTSNGTSTDFDGNFTINVSNNATLVFSSLGFTKKEIVVGGNTTLSVLLEEDAEQLGEVVVTALGIKREQKALGYAVSKINAEQITEVANPNVVSSLYGKAAGVQIRTNPGGATAGVNVVIRGNNSITGFNQPLFVVDGVPIDHGDSEYSRWGGSDAGNGAGDINPEDVESMTILKGANASALYGSKAANGVVVITTKSGTGSKSGMGITYSGSVTADNVAYLPDFQNVYGSGTDSQVFRTNDLGENTYAETYTSFGPKMEGQPLRWWDGQIRPYSPQPNNVKNIYNTGYTTSNSVAVSDNVGGKLNYRLSYTNFDYTGTFPGVYQKRNVYSLNTKLALTEKFDIGLVANFYDIFTKNRPARLGGLAAYEWPRSTKLDLVKEMYKENGYYNGALSGDNAPSQVRNFMSELWNANENSITDDKGRLIGNVTFNYKPFSGFNIRGRIGTDLTNTDYINKEASREPVNSGKFRIQKRKTKLDYSELILTYNKDLTEDFSLSVLGGGSISSEKGNNTWVETNGFIKPNWFSLNNSSNTRNSGGEQYSERTDALFGVLGLVYRNMIYVEGTARNDWSSTLPSVNNSYFYPSLSTSFVFSEVMKDVSWLNFGKLRASLAKTGNDAKRYQANKVYSFGSYNGVVTNSFGSSVPPISLLPENQVSFEIGTEIKMFNNRLGLDFTYYHNQNKDQIIDLGVAPSTSASSITTNIGQMDNKGIELQLYGTILRNQDFSWDARVNFAKNENEIIALAEGIDQFPLASLIGGPIRNQARVGRPFGEWVAYVYERDDNGNKVINSDGLYIRDDSELVPVGNSTPDFIGGFTNTFTYKGFRLNMNIDFSVGGDIFSFTNYYGLNTGKLQESLKYRDEENGGLPYYNDVNGSKVQLPSHTSSAPNGEVVYHDGVILEGVTEDGAQNQKLISAFSYYDETYYWNYGFHEEGLFDNSYVKMREVSLGYSFNRDLVKKIGFQDVSMSLIGRNLFYLYKNVPNIDPESSMGTSSGEASAFESGALPGSRSLGVSLKVSF